MIDKLYLTIDEAAKYVGIGQNAMRSYVDSQDPPPILKIGATRYVQKAALARYFEHKQTWAYPHTEDHS